MRRWWAFILLSILSLVGIIYCFKFFSKGNLTVNEQVLFSIFLTIASFFLSWLVSHYYYLVSHEDSIAEIKKEEQAKLKVYATKAAEKVTNLSAEFSRLSNYLKEELDEEGYETDQENLHAKEERIYSAIHIVSTLKSINDGSLSDWKGVIPEEIEEIEEKEREKVENLNTILNRYESVIDSSVNESDYGLENDDVREEIYKLNKKLDVAISSVGGTRPKIRKQSIKREIIERDCPSCGHIIEYKQKPIINSKKTIKCFACNQNFACAWNPEKGFSLTPCDAEENEVELKRANVLLDENLINIVRENLPLQPWPKKTTISISEKLGISTEKVRQAIQILIKRGVFKQQINGVLYVPYGGQETEQGPVNLSDKNAEKIMDKPAESSQNHATISW